MFIVEPLPKHPFTLPQSIARMEGWYNVGPVPNRPQRNNNPGNISFGAFAERYGAVLETTAGTPRFACFPTPEDGWECLTALLSTSEYAGLTVAQCIARYAPPEENNTPLYISSVCQWCGCQETDFISDVLRA